MEVWRLGGNTRRAAAVWFVVAAALLPPFPVLATHAESRPYQAALGGGIGDLAAGLVTDCDTTDAPECALLTGAWGGAAFPTQAFLGKTVRATARDDTFPAPALGLGIDVDGDGCIGCNANDILYRGCTSVDGIVLHTTRGDTLTVFVHSLWIDPTTGEACLATQGEITLAA